MSSYNLESVEEMAGGDQDFLKIVVQTFVEEIPPDLHAMNEAVAAGNAGLAYQYAHKMKPNLQMFGLDLMPQIKVIETWAKKGTSREEVESAAEVITSKVLTAEQELIKDFELE